MRFAKRSSVARPTPCAPGAFTLLELLVVIGIISVLLSILLPALHSVRRSARAQVCASNLRQLCLATMYYASENRGKFPPNMDSWAPGTYWYDRDRIGKYLKGSVIPTYGLTGPLLSCPEDSGARRSYSMNFWASSKVDQCYLPAAYSLGTFWDSKVRQSAKMILLTESLHQAGSPDMGWFAVAVIGKQGVTPGQRFGVGGGLWPPFLIKGGVYANCELPYERHRVGRAVSLTRPQGRVNIAYADGHVAMKAEKELADAETGRSRLDSLWSPLDPSINE